MKVSAPGGALVRGRADDGRGGSRSASSRLLEDIRPGQTRLQERRMSRADDGRRCARAAVVAVIAITVSGVTPTRGAAAAEADPWRSVYTGVDASGPHVLALWQFDPGADPAAALRDVSGHGHDLTLAGAELVAAGKFAGGLRSFAGWPVADARHAALAPAHPRLSPTGAFTIDLWLAPAGPLPEQGNLHLLCKKYVSHHDYQLALVPAGGTRRALQLTLGFGTDSESFVSAPADWPAGTWRHVAVTYDGAGTVRFHLDGGSLGGRSSPARRSISPGPLALTIGDRTGSLYGGFPGVLDQVRLSSGVREFAPAGLALSAPRRSFLRMEPVPTIAVVVRNQGAALLTGARLDVLGLGPVRGVDVPELAAGAVHRVEIPFDTTLRPGTYDVTARLTVPGDVPVRLEESLRLALAPRPLAPRMPVLMWGIGSPEEFARELPRLESLGFTHCLGFGADYGAVRRAAAPAEIATPARKQAIDEMLDVALARGFRIAAQLAPGHSLDNEADLWRVDREGRPYERRNADAIQPGLAEFCEHVGTSVARTFGTHPAFAAALINTEVRDSSQVSFSAFDRAAYRAHAGADIPAEVETKNGVQWAKLADVPADRVIPDDHPVLAFYRWFWTVGDGWNGLHSAVHRGLESSGRTDLWTWFDPAIRAASIGGSGGEVDVLGQWTYTEPSPLRVGYFADEVLAMARAAGRGQRVMKMTQLFWYRSSSAPANAGAGRIANPFDDHDPDAAYISIAPGHLRGAFWTKLARPLDGLMYHGWASLVPTDGTSAYKHTQPDLETEFRRLHHEVLPPLAPLLLAVRETPCDVAYLDSFTAQMFARRGSYGYSHDEAYLTVQHAGLHPEVIFEETLLAAGLDGYRVLVLADCDVLPRSVAERILAFQKRGGLVIGDPNLAPAIRPDITIPKFTRRREGAADKRTILAHAAALRGALVGRYAPPASCDEPEIVVRRRRAGAADYVFAVNDRREAGTYVGQHGLLLDQGLPSAGTLSLERPGGVVYDLTTRRQVAAEAAAGTLRWPVALGPCDGSVFVVTDRPIERLDVAVPERVRAGSRAEIVATVADAAGAPVDAVIPVEVDIRDPHGRPAEPCGHHATNGGRLALPLDVAPNDTPGAWTVRLREAATGRVAMAFFLVEPSPRP
jgi:hypothetical protein